LIGSSFEMLETRAEWTIALPAKDGKSAVLRMPTRIHALDAAF
jgi:hypothetical protein